MIKKKAGLNNILWGLVFTGIGLLRITVDVRTHWGVSIYPLVNYLFLAVGCLFMGSGLYQYRKTSKTYSAIYLCSNCETVVPNRDYGDGKCPKCGGELEPLEGFYERHPELKDEE